LYYGGEVEGYRKHFEEASETTYALLCCRFARGDDRLAPSRGDHAERRLLTSPLWTQEIPAALMSWSPLNRTRVVVTMAINRTPCRECVTWLTRALTDLQWEFAQRFQDSRFILACRGAYRGKISGELGFYDQATTGTDLMHLADAGWELCVLQVAEELAPSGRDLLQTLQRQTGARRVVVVRLQD
jgi:hypothetical protein